MVKVTITTGVDPFPHTIYYKNGKEVWPCRCGETHRGEYGKMDWLHHNCNHDEILVLEELMLEQGEPIRQGLCMACGKIVRIVYPISQKE